MNKNLLEAQVNSELEKVYSWLASNKLTLNVGKFKYMLISKKKTTSPLSIKVNGELLQQCESYKYLGVYIDQNLSWKPHIEYISKKVSKACGALAKIRHYVNTDILRNVYFAVNSYLRYRIVAWGLGKCLCTIDESPTGAY